MRPSAVFASLLSLATLQCGGLKDEGPSGPLGDLESVDPESCVHPREKTDGEWPRIESLKETFNKTLVSSPGEDSFRTLSCGVENSARQSSFEWTAPYNGSFTFAFVLPSFTVPAPIISLAVLSGDCTSEELFCKSSPTTRVGFDLELTAGQEVTVLLELDDRVGEDDMELSVSVTDSQSQ
jgi:hypothetical protein